MNTLDYIIIGVFLLFLGILVEKIIVGILDYKLEIAKIEKQKLELKIELEKVKYENTLGLEEGSYFTYKEEK